MSLYGLDKAKEDVENPRKMLRRYADYFDEFEGIKIANICGSCGKKAIPLALLGADVTVFDISEGNKKYAMEVAEEANVDITYEVGDVLEKFDEHPAWENETLPGEFTAIAIKK